MHRTCLIASLMLAGCFVDTEDIQVRANQDSQSVDFLGGFGADVVPVPLVDGTDGVRFVVAGDNPFSLTTVFYDGTGFFPSVNSVEFGGPARQLFAVPPVMPGFEELIAVSDPMQQNIDLMSVGRFDAPFSQFFIDPTGCPTRDFLPGFGRDLALPAGAVMFDGGVAAFSFAAPEITCVATCDLPGVQALAAANLLSMPGIEVIAAVQDPPGSPVRLELIVDTPDDADCVTQNLLSNGPPAIDPRVFFGADINGSGDSDLVLFNPIDEELIVVPDLGGATPSTVVIPGARSATVADVIPGLPGTEILVGVPISEEGDDGFVEVLSLGPPGPDALRVEHFLRDSTPEDNGQYGRSLATAPFRLGGAMTPLPIVGANGEVFTVFKPHPDAIDPRE